MVRVVGPSCQTLQALSELDAARKASQGYLAIANHVISLEVATLQDIATYGNQALLDLRHLSNPSTNLWYTLTHLLYATAVPFALIYPASAAAGAHTLSLPTTPTTHKFTQLFQQGKQWIVDHPAMTTLAAGITLAGLGLAVSRLGPTSVPKPFSGAPLPVFSTGSKEISIVKALFGTALGGVSLFAGTKLFSSSETKLVASTTFPMPFNPPLTPVPNDSLMQPCCRLCDDGFLRKETASFNGTERNLYYCDGVYYLKIGYDNFKRVERDGNQITLDVQKLDVDALAQSTFNDSFLTEVFTKDGKPHHACIDFKNNKSPLLWVNVSGIPHLAAVKTTYYDRIPAKLMGDQVVLEDGTSTAIQYKTYEWQDYFNEHGFKQEDEGMRFFIFHKGRKCPVFKHPRHHEAPVIEIAAGKYVFSEIRGKVAIRVEGKLEFKAIYTEPLNPSLPHKDASIRYEKGSIRRVDFGEKYSRDYCPIKLEDGKVAFAKYPHLQIVEIDGLKEYSEKFTITNQGLSVTVKDKRYQVCKFGDDYYFEGEDGKWSPVLVENSTCKFDEGSYSLERADILKEFEDAEVYTRWERDRTRATQYLVEYENQLLQVFISKRGKILGIIPNSGYTQVIEALVNSHATIDGRMYRTFLTTQEYKEAHPTDSFDPRCFGPCNPNGKTAAVRNPSTFMRNQDGLEWKSSLNSYYYDTKLPENEIGTYSYAYLQGEGNSVVYFSCDEGTIRWLNIDGKSQIVGVLNGNVFKPATAGADDATIVIDGKSKPFNGTTLGIKKAFAKASQTISFFNVNYIEFCGQKCPIFKDDKHKNLAIKIGDRLVLAFYYKETIGFSFEGQSYSAPILRQNRTYALEMYHPNTPLERYDADAKDFIMEYAGEYQVLRGDDPSIVILKSDNTYEYGEVSTFEMVTRLKPYPEKLGRISWKPLNTKKVYKALPDLEISRPGYATKLFVNHNGKEIPLRAWPSQKDPQVYLGNLNSNVIVLPRNERGSVTLDSEDKKIMRREINLATEFNEGHTRKYSIGTESFKLAGIGNCYIAKSSKGVYSIAYDKQEWLSSVGSIKLDGKLHTCSAW
ncbi:MAG: hypothetical protein Q8K75_01920 [Chlamydiales bacterium]|nr:hypothetical protein [Chlamydiales bacterium]